MSRGLKWLHGWAVLTAVATGFLVFAGGMVTSTGSGLAVPDWPLSYGTLFPPMVGGVFYEHGHRLVAGGVALLTAVLTLLAWRLEPRRWIRRIATTAMACVLVQAALGGLTVIFLLPTGVSVAHAGTANLFFCLVVTLAVVTSPGFRRAPIQAAGNGHVARLWAAMTVLVYGQILLGAWMRHLGAGLAIPDFPLAFGRFLPSVTSLDIAVHFAHRIGAVLVVALACVAVVATLRGRAGRAVLFPALALAALLPVQILLGALTIWSGKAPVLTTFHVTTGTLILGLALWAALAARRSPAMGHSLSRLMPAGTAAREGLA